MVCAGDAKNDNILMTGLLKLLRRKAAPPIAPKAQVLEPYDYPIVGLRGKQHVVCWFVCRTGEKDFTERQKRSLLKELDKAKAWLATQAEAYGFDLAFTPTTCFGFDHTLFIDEVPSGMGDLNEASFKNTLVQRMRWASQGALFANILIRNGANNAVSLVFISSPGRSFASQADEYERERTFSTAFVYKQTSESGSYGSIITHELLHLHGAIDLYAENGKYGEQYSHALRLYPTDIMLHSQMPLCDATAGPFTAYLVGWHNPTIIINRGKWPAVFQKFRRE